MQEVTFGENSTEYAATQANIAHVHERLGNTTAALQNIEAALKTQQSKVGLNHSSVANSFVILGKIHLKMGLYSSAVASFTAARRIVESLSGKKDPLYWQVQAELGGAYVEMGTCIMRAWKFTAHDIRKCLSFASDVLLRSFTLLSEFVNQMRAGLYDVAQKLQKECLVQQLTATGENSVESAKLRGSIGRSYYGQGKYAEASVELLKASKVLKEKLGSTHPDYMDCLNALVSVHYHLGEFDQVIPLYKDTLDYVGAAYGKEHAAYLTAEQNLQLVHQYVSAAKSSS